MKVRLIFVLSVILALSMSTPLLSGQQGEVGRPRARAWSRVAVQPMGIKCPAEAVQPPVVAVSSNDFVQLERTRFPYTVKIHADGRIVWQRNASPVSKNIQPEDARALIERIRASGFWSLCETYPGVTDHPSEAITTVRIGDQEKQVTDVDFRAPEFLRELEYEIDLMADTHRHFHGDPTKENIRHLDWDSWYAKAGVTKLMRTSARGSLDEVKKQLSAKPDPNAQDSSGWTALMYASLAERPEIMQALLDAGADPNLRSHRGQTGIMAVSIASWSLEEKMRMLRAAGGEINAQDADGQTALMIAAEWLLMTGTDRLNIVSILLKEGARKDLRDARGHTVLDRLESKARSLSFEQYEKLRRLLED
jgi:hypothetical protein